MKADLHVHSSYSDGSDSMEEVMKQAVANGITQISFVDHDTVAGLPEALALGRKYGIEVVPGIEISAYDFKRKRKVHILGYHYDSEAPQIQQLCQPLLERRHHHSMWQLEQIRACGFKLNADDIIDAAHPSSAVYKQHIMTFLTDAPYDSPEYKQLYQRLFKNGGIASGDITYADAFDAVQAIVADGGLAVVAHPGQLNSYDIIPELAEAGLGGIERNHPDHTAEDHKRIEVLAAKYNFVMTGGTDYHGTFGTPVTVGDFISDTTLTFL